MSLADHNETGLNAQDVVAICIFASTTFLGTLGNVLVLIAVGLSQQLQTLTNIFVIALAITDLLTCSLLPVQIVALVGHSDSVAFHRTCTVVAVASHVFFGYSAGVLTLVAYNRFYLITRSRAAYMRFFNVRNIVVALVVLGCIIFGGTVAFAATGVATFGHDEGVCAQDEGHLLAYISGVWLLLSLILIIVCYVKIFRYVKHHPRSIAARMKKVSDKDIPKEASVTEQPNHPVVQSFNSAGGEPTAFNAGFMQRQRDLEAKITTNMLIIIVLYFLCVCPSIVTLLLPGDQDASAIVIAMMALNSCLNPFVYAWKHPVFSRVLRSMLFCKVSHIKEPTRFARYLQRPHFSVNGSKVVL